MEHFEEDIFCIYCGYDLRGTADGRCSECGKPFCREEYRKSVIPWENRGRLGYFRTLIKILFGKRLVFEIYREHDLVRAGRFLFLTTLALATAFAGGYLIINGFNHNALFDGLIGMANQLLGQLAWAMPPTGVGRFSFVYDFMVVMGMALTGWMGWLVPPVVLAMLARDWVHAPGDVLRGRNDSPKAGERAVAMGCYLSAYWGVFLILVLLELVFQAICFNLSISSIFGGDPRHYGRYNYLEGFVYILAIGTCLFAFFVLPILMFIRTYRWRRAIYRLGFWSFFSTAGRLVGVLVWRGFFWIIFIPLVAGLIRLVVVGLLNWR